MLCPPYNACCSTKGRTWQTCCSEIMLLVVLVVIRTAAAAAVVAAVVVVVVAAAAAKTRSRKSIHNTSTVNGANSDRESYLSRSNRMVCVCFSFNNTRSTVFTGSNINSSICCSGSNCNCNRNCIQYLQADTSDRAF